jgi:hypothetical protein
MSIGLQEVIHPKYLSAWDYCPEELALPEAAIKVQTFRRGAGSPIS